jgi:hypothetical protein
MNIKDIDWRAKLRPLYRFAAKLPPVVRSLAGIVLIGAGFLGIVMPILGFWMAPLGLLFIAADIPPLRRRVERWLEHDRESRSGSDSGGGSAPGARMTSRSTAPDRVAR